jgi:predicted phosphodiesterase
MGTQRLIVASDVHLAHAGAGDTGSALARLVHESRGAELVLAGDIFNLSLDAPGRDPVESVISMLRPHTELTAALSRHLAEGHPLTLIPGNHDAAVAKPGLKPALQELLGVSDAPLTVANWFIRRGPVHLEHGHVYDPDNAPAHPLVVPSPDTEPLGVALTRDFLAPNQAFDFAHGSEFTPIAALRQAVQSFGARMPLVLMRYFATSSRLCLRAREQGSLHGERTQGEAELDAEAERNDLDAELLSRLAENRPKPTHTSFSSMFFRLYFDRVIATTLAVSGTAGALVGGAPALSVGALGALYLAHSVRRKHSRYGGLPIVRLREAAREVRELTGAELVVFGHTHVEDSEPGYVNSASFTYRSGRDRPYLVIDERGEVERKRLSD